MFINTIKIDLERIASSIDPNIFGGYMEIGLWGDTRYDYLDVGDSPHGDKKMLRDDIRSAFEQMNLRHIRFPGGNFASGYRWIEGVGPYQERPTHHDLAQFTNNSNQYGTNEFIKFCRLMNIEPYLCANCGDGNMREAADWVEYCNGTANTLLANLRRQHGYEKPHKVKYWGIGNEVDGQWQIGCKTPQEYARTVTEFSKVMKWTDPEIKLIASAVSLWEDNPHHQKTDWVERVQLILEQAGEKIDFLSIHRYAHLFIDEPFENYMAFAQDLDERIKACEGLIRAVSLEKGIKHDIGIAVDEWAIWRYPTSLRLNTPISVTLNKQGVAHPPVTHKEVPPDYLNAIDLEDAVVAALYLNTFIRNARSIRMTNFAAMPTLMGIDLVHPDKPVVLPTIFYPFQLYSRTCGQQSLDVFWDSEVFTGTFKNRTYKGIRILDIAATLDETRKKLVVYAVNQSKEKEMETTISLVSGHFNGSARVSFVNGPDVKAENTDEYPNRVATKEITLKVTGKSFSYTFEPHSVTALICDVS